MKNSFPLAQKMLPEIYSTVDMIMKGRPLLVLLLFAASAVILAGMYYAANARGERRHGRTNGPACCRTSTHAAAASTSNRRSTTISRASPGKSGNTTPNGCSGPWPMPSDFRSTNCANAIVRLGGRYAPPEHVTVFRGTTDDNLRRSIDFARRPPEGLHADDIERALQSGNRYAARVLIWARSGDMRHLALMETCRRRLAANGPADARNEIAGRRANNGTAGVPANGTAALQDAEQQKVRKTVGRTLRQTTPRKAIWSVRPAATSIRRGAAIPTAPAA